jgi:hypothetical protein
MRLGATRFNTTLKYSKERAFFFFRVLVGDNLACCQLLLQDGNLLTIRAVQEPSGVWRMPEGTILPKDPVSMARIVEIGNDLGEIFHCVLPKRKKPHNAEWLDIPQVPVIEDISTAEAESHLRLISQVHSSNKPFPKLHCA